MGSTGMCVSRRASDNARGTTRRCVRDHLVSQAPTRTRGSSSRLARLRAPGPPWQRCAAAVGVTLLLASVQLPAKLGASGSGVRGRAQGRSVPRRPQPPIAHHARLRRRADDRARTARAGNAWPAISPTACKSSSSRTTGSRSATIEIDVRNGSFTQTPDYAGLAHMYEHMFFQANASYPDPDEFLDRTAELGAVFNGPD